MLGILLATAWGASLVITAVSLDRRLDRYVHLEKVFVTMIDETSRKLTNAGNPTPHR